MFIASAASGCSFLPASSVSVSPGLTNITSPLLPAVVRLSGMSVSTVLAHWSGSLWFSFFAGPPYMRPVLLHANVKKTAKSAADPDSATLYLIYKNLCRCSYSSFSVSACVSVSSASSRPSASRARSARLLVFCTLAACVSLMLCACASCSARFSFSRRR